MKLISLLGNSQLLDGGAMFGNAPRAVWQKWSEPDSNNRIALACRCLLLQTDDGKNILFEAGIGAFFDPKLRDRFGVSENEHVLLKSLQQVGLSPDDIQAVVLSHLHFDHAGGVLSDYNEGPLSLLFNNAKFYVGEDHWKRALNPHSRDKASFIPVLQQLLLASGRLTLVKKDSKTDLEPLVNFRFSDGHTPGLMLAQINLKQGPLVFASDLIPGLPWVHVPISMGYDRFPELVIDEKNSLLHELVEKNGSLFFTHDPNFACGKVQFKDNKYSAEVIDIQTLI